MLKKKTISIDTKFSLPEDTTIVHHKDKILIIAPECANYIVLENDEQLSFYNLLQTLTLGEALKTSNINNDIAQAVLVQIEAKKFTNEIIPHSNGRFQLHLFLTNACNLRCRHCYMYSGKKEDKELTFEEISAILKAFSDNEGEFVTFSGGEPTTREDFFDILKLAYDLGLHINVMTNGTLWTDNMIEQAKSWIESVQVSIDGFNETENAKVRGEGNFERSLHTVDLFLKHNIRTTIAVTPWLDESLENNIVDYVNFKHKLQSKYEKYPLILKFTSDLMDGRELKVNSQQCERYNQMMKKISDEGHLNMEEDIFVYNQIRKVIKDSWCTYGHLTISATGDIYFCGKTHLTKSLENIRNIDLKSVMDLSKEAREAAKIHNIRPCNNCELKYICGGGCRIKYFDWFTDCKNIHSDDIKNIKPRQCDLSTKQHFYDLMIQSNHKMYK